MCDPFFSTVDDRTTTWSATVLFGHLSRFARRRQVIGLSPSVENLLIKSEKDETSSLYLYNLTKEVRLCGYQVSRIANCFPQNV
jgi:hypothetical protein